MICYLSNGYPSLEESSRTAVMYAEAGCGIIEVDLPCRNPYMDNELIAGRMRQALEQCDDYKVYRNHLVQLKNRLPQVHFLLLVYEDTICEMGVELFAEFCMEHGFMDIILTGVRGDGIRTRLMELGLCVSCYVTSHMPEEEVEQALDSNGFIYLQAKPFRAGDMEEEVSEGLKERIQYLRDKGIDRPIYCGVGISTPEDVAEVRRAGGDAVFVGSAVLKLQQQEEAQASLIRQMKMACER